VAPEGDAGLPEVTAEEPAEPVEYWEPPLPPENGADEPEPDEEAVPDDEMEK
jgi:hypothetical protein